MVNAIDDLLISRFHLSKSEVVGPLYEPSNAPFYLVLFLLPFNFINEKRREGEVGDAN